MKDRIKQLMESQHLSQQSFADKIQISPATLSSIFSERTKPTLKQVDAIRDSFPNINLEWLLYGVGEMFRSPNSTNSQEPVATQSGSNGDTLMFDFSGQSSPLPHESTVPTPPQTYRGQGYRSEREIVKMIDKPQRQITEIRIFYDDQTWETFVPKK